MVESLLMGQTANVAVFSILHPPRPSTKQNVSIALIEIFDWLYPAARL